MPQYDVLRFRRYAPEVTFEMIEEGGSTAFNFTQPRFSRVSPMAHTVARNRHFRSSHYPLVNQHTDIEARH